MSAVIQAYSPVEKVTTRTPVEPMESPAIINPLENSEWEAQLAEHPEATFFHGTAWARVLRET